MTKNNIELFFEKGENIPISKREVMRYLGYKQPCDKNEAEDLYEECLKEYFSVASYKAVFTTSDILVLDGEVKFEFCCLKSDALCKNLSECKKAYIFAATVGVGVDRLITKYSVISPVKAMIIDCIASAGIEEWCDKVNDIIKERCETKPRFSPGYGGVPLCCQEQVLEYLDANRKIGITLNSSYMMIPIKSVSAFIGIKENEG